MLTEQGKRSAYAGGWLSGWGWFRRMLRRSHGCGRGRDAPVEGAERHDNCSAGLRSQERVEAKGLQHRKQRLGTIRQTVLVGI